MTNKHFYSHLVSIDSFTAAFADMPMSDEEKKELLSLIESNIHHTILDLVLSELSEGDKQLFLSHLAEGKHDQIWELLNKKVSGIEEKIQNAADDIARKMHEDIKKIKKSK